MVQSLFQASPDADPFRFERTLAGRGFSAVAGTDEAGRGPLAGPVVAAAVILPAGCDHGRFRDSKQTTEKERLLLRELLRESGAAVGIGVVSTRTIDRINILQASLLAMMRSVDELGAAGLPPDFILVDGNRPLPLATPQQPLVGGDGRCASIAAASIVAKLCRDEIMADLHTRYPAYNFIANKGYPTAEHRRSIARFGPCPVHRRSFKGVREYVQGTGQPRPRR